MYTLFDQEWEAPEQMCFYKLIKRTLTLKNISMLVTVIHSMLYSENKLFRLCASANALKIEKDRYQGVLRRYS